MASKINKQINHEYITLKNKKEMNTLFLILKDKGYTWRSRKSLDDNSLLLNLDYILSKKRPVVIDIEPNKKIISYWSDYTCCDISLKELYKKI